MANFVEVHKYKEPNKVMLIDLEKAEMIQDNYISFQQYAVNVEETYEDLKDLFLKKDTISYSKYKNIEN